MFAMDADMRFVDYVGAEILGDLVAGLHPEYYNIVDTSQYPYERRISLCAGIPYGHGLRYYQGTIFGGRLPNFLNMLCYIDRCLKQDYDPEQGKTNRSNVARVEDESYLNRYLLDHHPTTILHPGYLWPVRFGIPDFPVKIEVITKDNHYLRDLRNLSAKALK